MRPPPLSPSSAIQPHILVGCLVPAFLGESHFAFLSYAKNFRQTPVKRELDYLRQLGGSKEAAKELKLSRTGKRDLRDQCRVYEFSGTAARSRCPGARNQRLDQQIREASSHSAHTARMSALLCNQGIEKLPDLMEENALLVEQNVILVEQRETDIKSLLRLQEKLDAIHTSHADAGHESSAAQTAGG